VEGMFQLPTHRARAPPVATNLKPASVSLVLGNHPPEGCQNNPVLAVHKSLPVRFEMGRKDKCPDHHKKNGTVPARHSTRSCQPHSLCRQRWQS
jgi:hypothetical protein